MPVIKLSDDSGDSMTVLDVDGYYLPCFPLENHEAEFRTLKNWKLRDDDIFICAYPKAGTHWMWEIISMLARGKAEYSTSIKENFELEFIAQDNFNSFSSPRILTSHLHYHQLPADITNRKCKIVFLYRNPKDVAVSFYNHHSKMKPYEYEGKWENYLQRFYHGLVDFGSWFDYTLDWEKVLEKNTDRPIHIIHYEDMKENTLDEIKKLAAFLGMKADPPLLKSITDMCSFSNMKKAKEAEEQKPVWRNPETDGMYRKGVIGDWKNWFTEQQNEEFNKEYKEKMKTSKLVFKYLH